MKRREYLKATAVMVTASMLDGCSAENPSAGAAAPVASTGDRECFDTGTTPIAGSGWANGSNNPPHYPALDRDLRTDIAIVGAGLAGSSLALHLAEAGVSTVVIEARQPGWGASGRNAGHVLPILKDIEGFRALPDGGRSFFELYRTHNTLTFDLAKQYDIACDAVQSGYLSATTSTYTQKHLAQEAAYWQKEQGQAVEILGAADMHAMTGSHYYRHGVLYTAGGRVNPYLLTNGLIAAATARGARVFGDSEALTLTKTANTWRVTTGMGSVIADRVVFCTNAYPTGIVPEFQNSFYPLTSYGLSTKPLPQEALDIIMPSRATLAQEPIGLHPLVIDQHNRLITASIPNTSAPEDAAWHFRSHLDWIHRTWPETRDISIEPDHYWTGRVALRDSAYPGLFKLDSGVFGLMHFNAWGNLMAPLMGKVLADALSQDRLDSLPIPLKTPQAVTNPGKQEFLIRRIMIPAARTAQKLGLV